MVNNFIPLKEVKGLNKYIGLMFKPFPGALVFNFCIPINYSIHSYFCRSFQAYWFLDGELIESKLIKPFQSNIKPKSSYNKLIEIPIRLIKNKIKN